MAGAASRLPRIRGNGVGIARSRLDPAAGERFVSLRRPLGVTSFGMNQLVLEPGQRGRIPPPAAGGGLPRGRGQADAPRRARGARARPRELVRVAPDLRRQLVSRGPDRVVLLALGGAGEHIGRDAEAFASWDDERGVPPQEVALPEDLPPAAGSG